jgi:MFS family permease
MSSGESVVGDGGGSSSVTGRAAAGEPESAAGSRSLAVLLAMAMFVLVVDTSLMNVSISKVVEDLGTTLSGVQGAIALEALVSAAFILIGSKIGDLIGRKRAFVLGLLGYALGALAMAFSQGLTAIIVFWAIIGGLGASLLLPAMQSLIHATSRAPPRSRRTRSWERRRRSPPPSGRCSAAS